MQKKNRIVGIAIVLGSAFGLLGGGNGTHSGACTVHAQFG